MSPDDLIAWFEEIAQREVMYRDPGGNWMVAGYDVGELTRWYTDAASALASAFPPSHPVMHHWNGSVTPGDLGGIATDVKFDRARQVFQSALTQLKAGRLKTLAQSVQAETVGELFDQADTLIAEGYAVAATVIAGGALETHLRHLCTQHGLSWTGDGSISKYDQAIAQHRNKTGQAVYSPSDSKSVIAWGGIRNDAAHEPANFAHSDDEVRLMIEGIRQFVARTT